MERIAYSISFRGERGEYPEMPEKSTHVEFIDYEIENLSRCCMQLREDVAALRSELASLRESRGE